MYDVGTKLCFVNNPSLLVEVIRPKPHEHKKKGRSVDGVIVPKTFVFFKTDSLPDGIRAWIVTADLRRI